MNKTRFKIVSLSLLATMLIPMTVLAENTSSTSTSTITETQSSTIASSTSATGTGEFDGYDTYDEMVEAKKAETLTPEEESEGYTIVDGYKYSPDELKEDSADGVIMGGDATTSKTGYVTFVATVPETIHEEVYVYVMNMNTYKEYGINLYEVNGYTGQMGLPAGEYQIEIAGLTADTQSRFYAPLKAFTVKSATASILRLEIKDSQESFKDGTSSAEVVDPGEVETEASSSTEIQQVSTNTVTVNEDTQQKSKWPGIIFSIITLIGIVILFRYLYKREGGFKKNKKNKYDD